MTSEQLEREAADRVRRMGYPDDLSDAERWHQFREDAELVAASNDVVWERVRELEAALREIAKQTPRTLRKFRRHGIVFDGPLGADPNNWQHVAFSLYCDLCQVDEMARSALAGGSDG